MIVTKLIKSYPQSFFGNFYMSFSQSNKPFGQQQNINFLKTQKISNCHQNIQNLSNSKDQKYKAHPLLVFKGSYGFCKSNAYVEHYIKIQTQIKEKKEKIIELQQKIRMLQQMSEMTTSDQIFKLLYAIFGKTYESQAFKQHKQLLIDLRNVLEKRIEESSIKWQQPRKLILSERQNMVNEFIEKIIEYEGKMAEFIKKRENNKEEHLADINQGLLLTHKLLIKNIEKEKAVQIKPEKGSFFNEEQHQVINGEARNLKNAKIVSLQIPGWRLKDKIVRKAKVTVN